MSSSSSSYSGPPKHTHTRTCQLARLAGSVYLHYPLYPPYLTESGDCSIDKGSSLVEHNTKNKNAPSEHELDFAS